MPTQKETIDSIINAENWDQRVMRMRQIPYNHGTNNHAEIYAGIAREFYVAQLAPDFAYIHRSEFYESEFFRDSYQSAYDKTQGFSNISSENIAKTLLSDPKTLLVFRTITGLLKQEFAHSVKLLASAHDLPAVSANKIDSMEQRGVAPTAIQAELLAKTLDAIMNGVLFGNPPGDLITKQNKPDTVNGWNTVSEFALNGVSYDTFLHQRHYGGAFRQILDATSTKRGDIIEDAVEELFNANGIPHIRTGSHNQAEIIERFEVRVAPAPDFVVFDRSGALRAILECKTINDGGTARDKALRFERLREEASRLGGIPLLAVLGGLGWSRVNDALGPVVRDTEGRVFTLVNLSEMLDVSPFPQLINNA